MNKILRISLILAVAIAAGIEAIHLTGPILQKYKWYRDWSVEQTRDMTDGIKMKVAGSFIDSGSNYRVLRVWSCWIGGDLHESHVLRASIRTTEHFDDAAPTVYWYEALGKQGQTKEGTVFLWAFHAPAGSPKEIWMRVFFRPKNSKESERWVDFEFPYYQFQDSDSPISLRERLRSFSLHEMITRKH